MVNKPKQKGTAFESVVVNHYKGKGLRVRRIALSGANDCGDIELIIGATVYVIECKNYAKYSAGDLSKWWVQAEQEAVNYAANYKDMAMATNVRIRPVLLVKLTGANGFIEYKEKPNAVNGRVFMYER